ncbi:pentafunctional arom protein [Cyclospora cayetanensis]|uniref:3-phosphoshikimate 1-carboxyvinyltransferase n=1 Tax=Cyclospora cayetanensis TaxID=88456 RepID=A0A1D3DAZ0_9EIME|nr:pentafunctional arom protein [Cyclospora cayetanensis]
MGGGHTRRLCSATGRLEESGMEKGRNHRRGSGCGELLSLYLALGWLGAMGLEVGMADDLACEERLLTSGGRGDRSSLCVRRQRNGAFSPEAGARCWREGGQAYMFLWHLFLMAEIRQRSVSSRKGRRRREGEGVMADRMNEVEAFFRAPPVDKRVCVCVCGRGRKGGLACSMKWQKASLCHVETRNAAASAASEAVLAAGGSAALAAAAEEGARLAAVAAETSQGDERLSAPSCYCFFIDASVLQHPRHRRRIKELAQQLCSSSSEAAPLTGEVSSSRSSGSRSSTPTTSPCLSCGALNNAEGHCYECCLCCFRPRLPTAPAAGEKEEGQQLPQTPQQTTCFFFAVDGGETAKTPQSAVFISETLLRLSQPRNERQQPQRKEDGNAARSCSCDSTAKARCSLRPVFCNERRCSGKEEDAAMQEASALCVLRTGEKPAEENACAFAEEAAIQERLQLDRQTVLVAVGGGALTDLVGFAASQLLRGLRCILVPTTVLAAVDAAVGGKTAVNLGGLKNMVGSFIEPAGCVIDMAFVTSLPERQIRCGLAEVVKIAAALSPTLLQHLLTTNPRSLGVFLQQQPDDDEQTANQRGEPLREHCLLPLLRLAAASVALKAFVVSADFKDRGLRSLLNLGHSLGHAIETSPEIDWCCLLRNHGECVAAGCVLETLVSGHLGVGTSLVFFLLQHAFRRLGLPLDLPPPLREKAALQEQLLQRMQGDKKNTNGEVRIVMLEALGCCVPSVSLPVPLPVLRRLFAPSLKLVSSCSCLQALEASAGFAATNAQAKRRRACCGIRPLCGSVCVPGSKSIANRALLLAALTVALQSSPSEHPVLLQHLPCCGDTTAMALALQQLGIADVAFSPGTTRQTFTVELRARALQPGDPIAAALQNGGCLSIWCGGSGTTSRFLLPLCLFLLLDSAFCWAWRNARATPACAAGADASEALDEPLSVSERTPAVPPSFRVLLDGDRQLRSRPIGDLVAAAKQLVRGWNASFCGASRAPGSTKQSLPVCLAFAEPLQLLQHVQEDLMTVANSGDGVALQPLVAASLEEERRLKSAVWQRVLQRYMPGGPVRVSNAISSQFASALLMVAPLAASPVLLSLTTRGTHADESCARAVEAESDVVSLPYLRMTQRVMQQSGFACEYNRPAAFHVSPLWHPQGQISAAQESEQREHLRTFTVEGDASTASYFFAFAAASGGTVTVNISRNSDLQGDCSFPLLLSDLGFGSVLPSEGCLKAAGGSDGAASCAAGVSFRGASEEFLFRPQNTLVNMQGMSDCLPTLAALAAAVCTLPCCYNGGSAEGVAPDHLVLPCSPAEQQRLQELLLRDLEAVKTQLNSSSSSSSSTTTTTEGGPPPFDCHWTAAAEGDWRYLCIWGVGCVRYKESNRLEAVASQLQLAGYAVWPDVFVEEVSLASLAAAVTDIAVAAAFAAATSLFAILPGC